MRGVLVQREVVLLEVGLDEELERPLTVRPGALDRERDEPPAERLGEVPGGQLALEQAAREIPQRPLAAFELQGIRPFNVTSPRVRRSAVSMVDVTVAPRAGVAARILGLVAPRANWP